MRRAEKRRTAFSHHPGYRGAIFPAALMFCLALAVFSAQAQETETGDWVRPNREAVREELRYARALTPDVQTKMDVLSRIINQAKSGGVSPEDKTTMMVLRYLAGEGTLAIKSNGSFSALDFPDARRAACEALGYIGGKSAREILLDVLKAETEPSVLSQAVFSLGTMNAEPDGELIRIFTALLERRVLAPGGDNNLAAALLNVIDKLADSKTGIRDEQLFIALIRMLDAPLTRDVRNKTMLLIEKMKGF
jgi:hypothetical protein